MYKMTILFVLMFTVVTSVSQAKLCIDLLNGKNKWNLSPVGLKKIIPLPTSHKELIEVFDEGLLNIGDWVRVEVKNPDLTTRSKKLVYEGAFLGFSGVEKSIVLSGGEQVQNYTSTIRTSTIASMDLTAMATPIRIDQIKEDSKIIFTDDQLTILADLRPSIFTGAMSVGQVARSFETDMQINVLQTKFKNPEFLEDGDVQFALVPKDSLSWVKQYSKILDIPRKSLQSQMRGRLMRKDGKRVQIVDIIISQVKDDAVYYVEVKSDMPVTTVWNAKTLLNEDFIGFYLLNEI